LQSGLAELVSGWLLIMDSDGATFGRKRGWLDPEYPFPAELGHARGAEDWQTDGWQEIFRARLVNQNFIATTSNMLFTRGLWERLGGFRDYRYCHDWDFALRAAHAGPVAWCSQYLSMYRIHGHNTIAESETRTRDEIRRMFRVLSSEFDLAPTPIARIGLVGNTYLEREQRHRNTVSREWNVHSAARQVNVIG
jgi:GT2 family glycosyltransferase